MVALYAAAVWLAADRLTGELLPQFVCFATSAFLMVLLNKQNALIRISTRMVSCSYVMLICMLTWTFGNIATAIVALCVVTTYLILFSCYQNNNAQGWFFYAFLSIGMASLVFPQILYFVPFIWLLAGTKLQSISLRSVCASLLAIILPYWFLAAFALVRNGQITPIIHHFERLGEFEPIALPTMATAHLPEYANFLPWTLNPQQTALTIVCSQLALIVLLFIIGTVHFLRHAYTDKLRTRQYFSFFMLMFALTLIFLVLQPQHREFLMPMLVINVAPLVAHFVSLTNTRLTNFAFVMLAIATVVLTAASLLLVGS